MAMKSFKLYGGLDINLWHRYQEDLFFRTACNVVALQVILTAVLIGVLWVVLQNLGRDVVAGFVSYVEAVLAGNVAGGTGFTENLQAITDEQFFTAITIVVTTVICFGLLTTYVAFTPTRRSFERKRRFINNIAHELRTPLAIVRTNTEVALLDPTVPAHLQDVLRGNTHELQRMSDIMNNLLSLSNVMQEQQMTFEDVDLSTVVEHALHTIRDLADQKKINVTVEHGDVHMVHGNAIALEQVIFNLLKNALTYTPKGGTVSLTIFAGTSEGYIDLIVEDTGSGIPHDDLDHVFEPFYRSRRAKKGSGSGLGLTIVNDIVQAHKGKIRIKSSRKHGTAVIVSLPRAHTEDVHISTTSHKTRHDHGTGERLREIFVDYSKRFFNFKE